MTGLKEIAIPREDMGANLNVFGHPGVAIASAPFYGGVQSGPPDKVIALLPDSARGAEKPLVKGCENNGYRIGVVMVDRAGIVRGPAL